MIIKKTLRFITRLRFVGGLANTCFKPGHFYSPIVALRGIKKREKQIWPEKKSTVLPNINLNLKSQTSLVQTFKKYYDELPFSENKSVNRYYFKNIFFSYTDGIILYSIIRHFKPTRIIEVGSGFSSALMLDTSGLFKLNLKLTFIEPYPKRLKSLLTKTDKKNIEIKEAKIQDIDISNFKILEKNDILFIDSTHISKTGSDVNFILFNILPILKPGVLIHFHDIFFPFEYSKNWVYQGRSWNESYILRAFLMNNNNYEIIMFNDFLHKHHKTVFEDMPLCYKNTGGSIWLKKVLK